MSFPKMALFGTISGGLRRTLLAVSSPRNKHKRALPSTQQVTEYTVLPQPFSRFSARRLGRPVRPQRAGKCKHEGFDNGADQSPCLE